MKKACVTIMITIMTSLFFSACEKTPERESSSVIVTETVDEKDMKKYVTLDEARKEVEELKGRKYLELTLPEKIFITKENSVNVFQAYAVKEQDWSAFNPIAEKIWDDYDCIDFDNDYYASLHNEGADFYYDCREYYHKDNPDKEYLDAVASDDYDYIVNNNDYYYSSSTWGYYGGCSQRLLWLDLDGPGFKKVAEYNILWGDVPDDTEYELEGGKMSVKDVIGLVEERTNDALDEFDGEFFKHRVAYVAVYKSDSNGLHYFNVITNRFVDDVPVDPCNDFRNNISKDWGKAIAGRGMLYYTIIKKDEISYFVDHYEAFKIKNAEEQNNIISLKYAVSSIKNQIATVGVNNIQQCGLVYLFSCDTIWQGSQKEYSGFGFSHFNKKIDDSVQMKPFWIFAIKGKKLYHNATVLVDAVDGTVYYFDYTS